MSYNTGDKVQMKLKVTDTCGVGEVIERDGWFSYKVRLLEDWKKTGYSKGDELYFRDYELTPAQNEWMIGLEGVEKDLANDLTYHLPIDNPEAVFTFLRDSYFFVNKRKLPEVVEHTGKTGEPYYVAVGGWESVHPSSISNTEDAIRSFIAAYTKAADYKKAQAEKARQEEKLTKIKLNSVARAVFATSYESLDTEQQEAVKSLVELGRKK